VDLLYGSLVLGSTTPDCKIIVIIFSVLIFNACSMIDKQYKYYLTALLDHPDTPVAILHRELAELRDFWSAHASSMKEYYLRAP